MKKQLPIALLGLLTAPVSFAQTTPCTATSTDCSFEYLSNVTTGSINYSSGCDNYTSAGLSTDVWEGPTYSISITPIDYIDDDEVAAWVDWNDDGDFDDANEDISYTLIVDGVTAIPIVSNFTVPAGTASGPKTLRVRLSHLFDDGAIVSCGTSTYGEVEDYILNVIVATAAPVADFAAVATTVPTMAPVTIADLSTNAPNSWAWTITPGIGWSYTGGTSATSQHPEITFTTTGLYTVELTSTNGFGSDTETKTDYIEVVTGTTPACAATSTDCDEYFTNVTLGSINNTTGCDNYAAYLLTTDVSEGNTYNLSMNLDTYYDDDEVAAWIDWNDDGDFTDLLEQISYTLVVDGVTVFPIVSSFSVPAGTSAGLKNLRVRTSYEPTDGAIDPCNTVTYGEVEDYYVNVVVAPAPLADFVADATLIAPATTVNFTDLSANVPTSWNWVITPGTGWSFAGGTDANSQNPQVTFTADGLYTVELTATNMTGSDTETKTDYIEVVTPVVPVADFVASATSVAPATAVTFTDLSTNLPTAWAWTITPATGWSYTGGTSASSQHPEVTFTVDGLYTIELTATNTAGSDTETKTDYIEVVTPVAAPVADFTANDTQVSLSATVTFTDISTNTPTSWAWVITPATGWSFTGGTTASSQNPQVTFTTPGFYDIQLTATNSGGSDDELKAAYVEVVDDAAVQENNAGVLSVYPNPTAGQLVIDLGAVTGTVLSVELFDLTGRVIASRMDPVGKITIDLTDEATGVYFVKVNTQNGSITEKVIRQ